MQTELGESFQPPSNSRLTRSAGDATYVPLLTIAPDTSHDLPVNISADIQLLAPDYAGGHDYARTFDSLAIIEGSSHHIRLWDRSPDAGNSALAAGLRIYVGLPVGDAAHRGVSNVTLCNLLPVPVLLDNRSSHIRVWSVGRVIDMGQENAVVQLDKGLKPPAVCGPLAPA